MIDMADKEYLYPDPDGFNIEIIEQSNVIKHIADALSECDEGKRVFVMVGIEDE